MDNKHIKKKSDSSKILADKSPKSLDMTEEKFWLMKSTSV